MMHGLHQHIAQTLDRFLRERRVVVFYDLREEFRPFLDEFDVVGTGVGDLPRVCIHDTLTAPPTKEELQRVRDVAEHLRRAPPTRRRAELPCAPSEAAPDVWC